MCLGGCLLQSVKDAAGEEGEDADEEEADPDDARYACLNDIPLLCVLVKAFYCMCLYSMFWDMDHYVTLNKQIFHSTSQVLCTR